MTGQEAYEVWRAAVPEFVCNVPGGPWDELSKAVRAGFDAIAAQRSAPALGTTRRLRDKLASMAAAMHDEAKGRMLIEAEPLRRWANILGQLAEPPIAPASAGQAPRLRLKECVEAWPHCSTGEYDPACCRFPKSCSCTVYDDDRVSSERLEERPEPQPAPGPPECLASHCPPPGRDGDYPECAPTAADLAKWAAEHVAPCPGCESLRRQCSELAGEVGALAGALTDIRDANPDAPARGYCTERARVALNLLHGSRLVSELARVGDAYHEYVVRELNKSIDETARLRAELERLRRGCGVHPGVLGYEHPECGFHWHGKDGLDVPISTGREPECPRCTLAEYIKAGQQLARSLHEATEPLLHGTADEQKLGRELRERHGLDL